MEEKTHEIKFGGGKHEVGKRYTTWFFIINILAMGDCVMPWRQYSIQFILAFCTLQVSKPSKYFYQSVHPFTHYRFLHPLLAFDNHSPHFLLVHSVFLSSKSLKSLLTPLHSAFTPVTQSNHYWLLFTLSSLQQLTQIITDSSSLCVHSSNLLNSLLTPLRSVFSPRTDSSH